MVVVERGSVGLLPSMLVVYGIGVFFLGTLLWLVIAQVFRNRARETLASKLDVQGQQPLVEGPAIVRGRVELEDEEVSEGAPVRLVIHQRGRQLKTKYGYKHRWVETRRELSYRPFYLRLPDGVRIRVVPNSRVMLADELDRQERAEDSRPIRKRISELTVGEEVIASGILRWEKAIAGQRGGYRGGGTITVMRTPPGQRLLLSTAPLTKRFQQCARHYRKVAIVIALFMLASHTVAFGPFHLLNAQGEVFSATDISRSTYETQHKSTTTTHYVISATGPNNETLRAEVSPTLYNLAANWSSVPFLVFPSYPTIHSIGTEPRTSLFELVVFVFIIGLGLFSYWYFQISELPWYERRRVIDTGDGPL